MELKTAVDPTLQHLFCLDAVIETCNSHCIKTEINGEVRYETKDLCTFFLNYTNANKGKTLDIRKFTQDLMTHLVNETRLNANTNLAMCL
ncbi:hypothetical protein AB4239_13350 [Vibrio sp. 10N.286.45.C10]|nr:hypothetical protein [Vibrio tasmaniensis]TKG40545.1 hypothetical protein FC060_23840 [Vibrio tasmaniensis]TKG59180.1 hypothetical protein FC072_20210 [Vibrio tasmaniensis]